MVEYKINVPKNPQIILHYVSQYDGIKVPIYYNIL